MLAALYLYFRWQYLGIIVRIFQEKPLFIIPRGQAGPTGPRTSRFPTADGLTLRGCYLTAAAARGGA